MLEIDDKPEIPLKREDKKQFIKLTESQVDKKIEFINNYIKSSNAAEGSVMDANSNVSNKNVHTLEYEMNKDILIQVNRRLVYNKLKELFDEQTAEKYIQYLEQHLIYVHDESSLKPYCVSISLYPFLLDGLKNLDSNACSAPKHLGSFCGGFINLMLAVASQFAGAVATCEFLMYFDYFARKDLGDNYLDNSLSSVQGYFSQIVYTINQPSVSRGFQSIFWNISIYDEEYFSSIFSDFVFPDGSKPNYSSLEKLQKAFMKWFNEERTKSLLTFPVITAACLNDKKELKDKNFENFICEELSKGNAFFIYSSDNASALSSCCFSGDEVIEVTCNKIKQKLTIKAFVNLVKNNMINLTKQKVFIDSWNPSTNTHETTRITGVLEKKRPTNNKSESRMYRVSTNDSSIVITGDHIVPMMNYHNKIETYNIEFYYNVIKKYKLDSTSYKIKPNYKIYTLDGWKECKIDLV